MQTEFILQAIAAAEAAVLAHESEIESLDRAIGDGDHLINVKRGLAAISAMREELCTLAPDVALQRIGMKLLSAVGGASGPLFASFFIGMAGSVKTQDGAGLAQDARAFAAGVDAVQRRGKADLGEKTMMDVLIPVARVLDQKVAAQVPLAEILIAVKETAAAGVEATRDLVATKGRAAFLGERSIGHIDAGAKSTQVIISAVCDLIAGQSN